MSESFLKKKIISNCDRCKVKKDNIQVKLESSLLAKKGDGDLLIICDMVEFQDSVKSFSIFLEQEGVDNYQIHSACRCRTKDFVLPSPSHAVYSHCDAVDLKKLNYKVVLVLGRSLYFMTKTDDIALWTDFAEYRFNQTYFIKEGKRIYPIPVLSEWLRKDNFNKHFVRKQLSFIKEHLANYSSITIPEVKLVKINEPNDFLQQYMNDEVEMAWDTETNSLQHFIDDFKVGCLTVSFDGETGYYLPFEKINKRLLSNFFRSKYQITANGKYDVKAMLRLGVLNSKVDEDITILFHMLNTERMKNGLKTIAWYIGYGNYDKELDDYRSKYKIDSYLDIPERILMPYATMDAIVTFKAYKWLMQEKEKQPGIYKTYKDIIIPVLPVFTKAEMHGMDVDTAYLGTLNSNLEKEIIETEISIRDHLKLPNLNVGSNNDLAVALEQAGLPDLGKVKRGLYKTGDTQLKEWSKRKYTVADLIIKYRGLSKLQSSFVGNLVEEKEENPLSFFTKKIEEENEGLAKHIMKDGKVHCTFGPARTDSLRSVCSFPNLQNQPKTETFRKVFKKPEGYYIGEADYSGFQLRIVCIMAKELVMEDIFLNKGGDLHSITGQGVFYREGTLETFFEELKKGNPIFETYRQKAKAVAFGFLFLRSAHGFKSDLEENWSDLDIANYIKENKLKPMTDKTGVEDLYLTVSSDIRNKFFLTYPGLEPWGKAKVSFAKENGYIDCILGGRRHIPYLLYTGTEKEYDLNTSHAEKVAVNTDIQAFEALTIYKAMIKINDEIEKRNLKSLIIGMVHDSLAFYIKEEETEKMYNIIKTNMEDHTHYKIPLLIDMKIGSTWGYGEKLTEKNVSTFQKRV